MCLPESNEPEKPSGCSNMMELFDTVNNEWEDFLASSMLIKNETARIRAKP